MIRQRFVSDGDGHWYLISADRAEDFRRWVESTQGDDTEWDGFDYSLCAVSGSIEVYTFESPRREAYG
jgi:hypothetical protein